MHVNINTEAMKHIRSAHEDHDGDLPLSFNVSAMRQAFIAGVDWQREYDAARGPRSVSGVGDAPWRLSKCETMDEAKAQVLPDQAGGIRVEWQKGKPCFIGFGDVHAINTLIASIRDQKMDVAKAALNSDCVTGDLPGNWGGDLSIFRMLSSIENRLMEISSNMNGQHNSQIAAHVETHGLIQKAESAIGRALDDWGNHLHDLVAPKDEVTGCAEPGIVDLDDAFNETSGTIGGEFAKIVRKAYENEGVMHIGVDLATGSDETHIAIRQPNGKFIPLEELSDELLDMIKDQMPVSQYVAEMARRKQVSNVVKDERDVRIEELQAKASTLEKQLHFYRLLAKSRQAALNAVYGALDSFEG